MLTAVLGAVDRAFPPALDRYLDRSTVVLAADGEILRGYTADDGIWRIATTTADVSPLYLELLVAYEDKRFWHHPGVDPLAVLRALGQMVANGRVVSGASTLTMQTVRLLEPRPRHLGSKLIEIVRALQLELHFSKNEILDMYLTLAPFGGNIEGVRAASLAYFGREPTALTPGEAAMLVAMPQSPARHRPDRYTERATAARNRVLARGAGGGVLTAEAAREAAEQPVPGERRPMPFQAVHLADALVAATPGVETISTTIDGTLQSTLEQLASRFVADLDPHANLAVVVVENATRRVRAYLGSAAYEEGQRAGQVDLARASRSPGSTLKPFIYGMGFEELLIHPETLVSDRPQRFGDYAPRNFDPVYAGDLTVREALIRSVNVPAVAVLDRLGAPRLAARLRDAGAALLLPTPDELAGLPIALGGVGMTLFDLTGLYAALANGGAAGPLVLTTDAPELPQRPLLSPLAAWYVTDILADAAAPVAMVERARAGTALRLAYKTGTSYGFRDAWALGYDARHTVGVWVGRPDGTPSPERYGRNTAAPLLFRIFDLLPEPNRDVVAPPPEGALIASTADLPDRLQRLAPPLFARERADAGAPGALRIEFPVDGTRVELPRAGDGATPLPLPLIATGGQRPLRWLVNGEPVPASVVERETLWQPDGRGAQRITVIDRDGRTAAAEIWLE